MVRDEFGVNDLGRVYLDDFRSLRGKVYKDTALEALDCFFHCWENPEVYTRHHFLLLMPHESEKGIGLE
jgi:hypothetical protein